MTPAKPSLPDQSPRTIPCWPDGDATRHGACNETIPDGEFETMDAYGWGWTEGLDGGSESGLGMFYACPWHRTDCLPEERASAIERNKKAKATA